MLLPSIKYDFTILRQVIMTLILLKTIHTLPQHYPIIGSSSRICWQVTMCARVDMGKEKEIRATGNIILLCIIV